MFGEAALNEDDPMAIALADVDVVRAISEATGSAVLQLCHNPILTVVTSLPALCAALYPEPQKNIEAYGVFLLWLDKRPASHIEQLIGAMKQRDEATLYALQQGREQGRRAADIPHGRAR